MIAPFDIPLGILYYKNDVYMDLYRLSLEIFQMISRNSHKRTEQGLT